MTIQGGDKPGLELLPPGILPLAEVTLDRVPLVVDDVGNTDPDRGDALHRLLDAPLRLDDDWPAPANPVEVSGGWIHPEVLDEDRPLFEALLDRHQEGGPEAVASACQDARLPVSPYRSPDTARRAANGVAGQRVHRAPEVEPGTFDLSGCRVLDLTTHWAGPLATMLLANAGATVIKIDPDCRPDGFRDRPRFYAELNGRKDVIDCDLRTEVGRHRFEELVSNADLLIESFSRRVMPNFGYTDAELRRHNGGLNTISIKPFGQGTAEANWLAYGPGVHAASGLGFWNTANPAELRPVPVPAAVAYPDFLTGIAAYATSFRLLAPAGGRDPAQQGRHVEISMAEVVRPLLADTHDAAGCPRPTAGAVR